jgi:sigma-54 dependent transcriptional regulator, acetoin dehydrogenase operon transcriptional activator AcoR
MRLTRPKAIQRARRDARDQHTTVGTHALADIIGDSPPIERARRLAIRAGQSESPLLIIGESGTGKELLAKAMHEVSRRANGSFIPINCAAIPESLIETELFGYAHGAFTGASREGRPSLFERAHRGTLFLDELADLSLHAQAALLRVVEEGAVTRVGGSRPASVDVRLIGAVNRPLEDLVINGEFRRDLYHRLCVIPLRIPPLRERRQDIPMLAKHFLEMLGDQRILPDEVLDYLVCYPWLGNVRELQNCLRYMVTMTDGPFTVDDLPQPYIQIDGTQAALSKLFPSRVGNVLDDPTVHFESLCPSLVDDHCRAILALIESANHTGVALGRRSLRDKLRQAGLAPSERAVRRRLHAMQTDGLVEWGRGRAGVRLTAKGRSARQQARNRIWGSVSPPRR